MYLCTPVFVLLFFFPGISGFFFLSIWSASCSQSWNFFHLRMFLFLLHSWRMDVLDIEFLVDSSFISLENWLLSTWRSWFLMRSSLLLGLVFPAGKWVISLWLLSRFYLSFIFTSWTVMYLGVDFFWFILVGI